MVSQEVIAALNPTTLQGEPQYDRDSGEITWTRTTTTTIKTQEIITIFEIPGSEYLIVTLKEGGGGGGGQPPPPPPADGDGDQQQEQPPLFTFSSFLAPCLPHELQAQHHYDLLLKSVPDFLSLGGQQNARCLDVIVSVRSGTGLASAFYEAALKPLLGILGLTPAAGDEEEKEEGDGARRQNSYHVTVTKDAETVKNFARDRWGRSRSSSSSRGKDKTKKGTVILLSGDGGIVDLLSGTPPPPPSEQTSSSSLSSLSSPDLPTIVLLPLGTGNALFHSLHKPHYLSSPSAPSHLVLSLRSLLKGRPAPLPTFQATFRPAAHPVSGADVSLSTEIASMTGAIVASYGFHAQLVWESDTPAYRVHGDKRFGMVAQELLEESHAYHAIVATTTNTSGETVVGKGSHYFNYVLTTLCSNLEKTFTISPASDPLDGVLRLVHFGGADGKRTMEIMGAAYNGGKHIGMEGVGYEAVKEIKVTTLEEDARWRKVCIDGTILELPKEGSMTVRRSPGERLQVVVLDA